MKYIPICMILSGLFAIYGASCSKGTPVDSGQGGAGGDTWGTMSGATTASNSATTGSGMTCKPIGATCQMFTECCDTNACTGGHCCVQKGKACSSDGECCEGPCLNGVCGGTPCKPDGQACVANDECCGMICVGGSCDGTPCGIEGTACSMTAQCCGGLGCVGGTCNPPGPCDNQGTCGSAAQSGSCLGCADSNGSCSDELYACITNSDCNNYLGCFQSCGGGPSCQSSCTNQFPAGVQLGNAYLQCGYCQQCPIACDGLFACP